MLEHRSVTLAWKKKMRQNFSSKILHIQKWQDSTYLFLNFKLIMEFSCRLMHTSVLQPRVCVSRRAEEQPWTLYIITSDTVTWEPQGRISANHQNVERVENAIRISEGELDCGTQENRGVMSISKACFFPGTLSVRYLSRSDLIQSSTNKQNKHFQFVALF